MPAPVPVATRLAAVLATDATSPLAAEAAEALTDARPVDRADRARTLLAVYDLHTAPVPVLGPAARWQGSPVIAGLKARLEADWLAELSAEPVPADVPTDEGVVTALRLLAARDRLPPAYRWLAKEASWPDVVQFLTLEGGPDAGFDDLVAQCQVGLSGAPKLELARNYWDEMGNGDPAAVHTVLHDRMVAAIGMPRPDRADLPVEALERAALGGLLTTNRWLQPELVGALGMTELQAGPRCRLVLQAFDRLGAPKDAYPFYAEHAEVDPRHGRDWLDHAVTPLAAAYPDWAARMLRGAWWRCRTNDALFTALHRTLAQGEVRAA